MKKSRKTINCNCGATFKINLQAVKTAASIICPLCGLQATTNNPLIEKEFEYMVNAKTEVASNRAPFTALANYIFNKKYKIQNDSIKQHNILID